MAHECFNSEVRVLRQRVAELEAVLRECRVALLHAYVNCPIVPKINEVLNGKE